MLKRALLAAVMTVALAAPALASHCPKDAAAIDHGLSVLNVSDSVKKQVIELRDKGLELHKAGKHEESETTLAEAMRLLLNSVS